MKRLLTILCCTSFLFGADMPQTTLDITTKPTLENQLKSTFSYNRINDQIDIFNIKEQELGGSSNYGSIGDASGFDVAFSYGLPNQTALYYTREYLSVHYADTQLQNTKHDLFYKYMFYDNPSTPYLGKWSIDLGVTLNSADNLDLKSTTTLNSLIQNVKPGSNIVFDGNGIIYNDSALYIYRQGELLVPFVRIADLEDNSFYARLITNLDFLQHNVNLFAGVKQTSIHGYITIEPSDSDIIKAALDEFGKVDLKRDEKSIFLGTNYTFTHDIYQLEAGYEYLKIFDRSSTLEATDDNHILTGAVSAQVTKDLQFFIGGKAMLHQFNGLIPYLYNEYTKHKYDKKYGYAKVGFIYQFDLNTL